MFVFPSSIHYINMCVCIYIYVYAFKQEIFYPRGFWSVTCYLGCTSTESFRSERCHFGHIRSQQLQFWLRASQEAQIQISWRHVGLCCPSAKIGTNQIVGKTSWPLLPRGSRCQLCQMSQHVFFRQSLMISAIFVRILQVVNQVAIRMPQSSCKLKIKSLFSWGASCKP